MTAADHRWTALSGARTCIVQAPMAGAGGVDLAVAAMAGGATGSLPCAMLTPVEVTAQVAAVRAAGDGPLNLNFFCHPLSPHVDDGAWRATLAPFRAELNVDDTPVDAPLRRPFDAAMAQVVCDARPHFVSFHFGLPTPDLLAQVRRSGARIIGNATSAEEADWLQDHGCDAVIVQGAQAGGHAGHFRHPHRPRPLHPLLADIVPRMRVPVIAAGGISDGADIAAALNAGAAAVQIGTLYLATRESLIPPVHRALLGTDAPTAFTNVFTGRMARGFGNRLTRALGPIRDEVPQFPHAATALAPLRAVDPTGFSGYWAGAGANRATDQGSARDLTQRLASAAQALLG